MGGSRPHRKGFNAFGDALGRHQFKHVANHESAVVYYNAILGRDARPDYSAVPHAVFTYPEIAGVGMRQAEAEQAHGVQDLLVGTYLYRNTAKGEAIGSRDEFAKLIVQRSTRKILGAHIVGPWASILIQEIINVMKAPGGTVDTITDAMHIHPALPEVVERACGALRPVEASHHRALSHTD